MNIEEMRSVLEDFGFFGFDSYECKATNGRWSLYAFDDNEYMKDGYPNGFVILKEGEIVFKGMMPESKEELITILKLTVIL